MADSWCLRGRGILEDTISGFVHWKGLLWHVWLLEWPTGVRFVLALCVSISAHLGSLMQVSADRCPCNSCDSSPSSSGWTGLASAHSGGFREGRAADCTSLLSLVLSGASGIHSMSGHLIPEGEEEVAQKCTRTTSDTSDREQDPHGTIQ